LFYGWPKEKLAVASNVNLYYDLDISVCEQYYQLGYNGKLHPFPLNLFLPRIKCGYFTKDINGDVRKLQEESANIGKYKKIYLVLSQVLSYIGIYNILYKLKITSDFKEWVTSYNPDIIYSQLSTLELIRFVSAVHGMLNKPLVLHIMDDWPQAINKPEFFFSYWNKVIDREFRNLVNKSSALFSICESMSEEYKIRYDKEFFPFHNPIEIGKWLPYSKTNW